ncbi:MAG: hypothetical protein ACJAZQ_002063 [Cognaticolwellia sp.]|jgi:hypothetical protein
MLQIKSNGVRDLDIEIFFRITRYLIQKSKILRQNFNQVPSPAPQNCK